MKHLFSLLICAGVIFVTSCTNDGLFERVEPIIPSDQNFSLYETDESVRYAEKTTFEGADAPLPTIAEWIASRDNCPHIGDVSYPCVEDWGTTYHSGVRVDSIFIRHWLPPESNYEYAWIGHGGNSDVVPYSGWGGHGACSRTFVNGNYRKWDKAVCELKVDDEIVARSIYDFSEADH